MSLWLIWICLAQVSGMLSHVDRYEVIRPRRLQQRHRRSLQDDQLYPETVQYELAIEGKSHIIYLEKNRNLLASDYTETHYSENGTRMTTSLNEEHCFYQGHIRGMAESSVSVGLCSGISGFVRARQQLYLIEPLAQSEAGDHAVYRQEHLKTDVSAMLYDRDQDQDQGPQVSGLLRSRSQETEASAGPQRFVELFVVVDRTEYERFGGGTKSRILGVVNHVDKLYQPLNIRIVLVGLEIWTERDLIQVSTDSDTTLENFLRWRQDDLLQRTKHDNAQFVTAKDFDTDTVGLANKFAMCTGNSGGVNQDHHSNPIGLASTVAHEMGHNLGMSHDVKGCLCGSSYSSENCIMSENLRTRSQTFPEFFSSCSVEQLAEFMERARPSCLDRPSSLKPLCGNALLDPGEECDCGTVEVCKNPCCDASTCRLTDGSQCAHGQCCDRCQFRPAGSVCRKSSSDCDLPEYCSGRAGDCPEDSFEMNGKPCYNQVDGFCYNGQCPTHEHHCWRLFGPGATVGAQKCFDQNKYGKDGANCGRDKFSYIKCALQNLKCGSIFCGGGGESITGKRGAYIVAGIECKLAVDEDKTRNIDMVPDGTTCGSNKVCLSNKCVDTSVYGKKEDCAKKCNNNGVCNHKNECHCNPGWAPPNCDLQYADLPQGNNRIIAGVCAVLTVLLVIVALTAGLLCRKKDFVVKYIFKRKVHSPSGKLNPMLEEPRIKERPQISHPTLMASTATRACAPLIVTPPKKLPSAPETGRTKPQPPCKPLPPLNKTLYNAEKPTPPPVPPVKPSPVPASRSKPGTPLLV